MGEAKRRQAERTAALAEARAIGERLLAVSTEAREEIAREVAGVAFAWGAGTCALRNVHAQGVIRARLGIEVPLVIGGMIYRAGPDRVRDVLAFCGPDNRMMRGRGGISGHWWLEAGGLVLDFSPPDWPHEAGALAEAEARQTGKRLGRLRFDSPPPPYVWSRRGEDGMLLPTARGEPPIGRAYYTPEPALPAEARETLADLRAVVGMLAPAGVEQAADA